MQVEQDSIRKTYHHLFVDNHHYNFSFKDFDLNF
jgi:hypothetical protein